MYKKITYFLIIFLLIIGTLNIDVLAENESDSGNLKATDEIIPMGNKPVIIYSINDKDELISENDKFQLYLNKDESYIKIKDKRNNYIWTSSPDKPNYEGMSSVWRNFSKSMIVCNFINATGTVKEDYFNAKKSKKPKYSNIKNGFSVEFDFGVAKMKITAEVTLTNDGISVYIPDNKIVNDGSNKLYYVSVFPFLGASYEDEISGYMFVPDGSGALILYSKPRQYTNMYNARVYGDDLSTISNNSLELDPKLGTKPVALKQAYLPVYGVVHGNNKNAFLADIDSGDEFCNIVASPSGSPINYNWTCAKFVYNDIYWQPSGGGKGFNTTTKKQNKVNAKVNYTFLVNDNANYSGMAVSYRNKLINQNDIKPKRKENNDIPLKIDTFMSETRKGKITTGIYSMTTAKNLLKWQEQLKSEGINNVIYSSIGANKGGVSQNKIGDFSIDSKSGGKNDFNKLKDQAKKDGGLFTNQINIASGFISQIGKKNIVYNTNGSFTESVLDKPIFNKLYYTNNTYMNKIADKLGKMETTKNVSMDVIGNQLYSNYDTKKSETRTSTMKSIKDILNKISNNTDNLLIESPNSYAFKYADSVYNVPDSDSKEIYESESVPFYQMILSGSVDMFSPYLNYRTNNEDDVLKLIDYGIYPSYIMTEKYSSDFINSNTIDIYASRFEDWKKVLSKNYYKVNNLLKNVLGKSIVNRTVVVDNVVVNTYDDASKIVINYSSKSFNYNGETIDAKSASYVKGE